MTEIGQMLTQDHIIAAARGWLGTPYRHQASLRDAGCDCLGLIRGVWREVYGMEPEDMPAYSPDWAEAGGGETLAEAARRHLLEIPCADYLPGDVLLFRWKPHLPAKHAGIAVTASTMIHAQDGARVSEITMNNWWKRRLAFAFRFPGVQH
jgi:NlpC/P60 family putative phage cell wall peptidase